jgi:hypothetical protein
MRFQTASIAAGCVWASLIHFSPLSASDLIAGEINHDLNLILRASDNNAGRGLSKEDCGRLGVLATTSDSVTGIRFKGIAQKFFAKSCTQTPVGLLYSSALEGPADPIVLWDGVPICQTGNSQILSCQHNAKTGRGLFIYSASDSPERASTLVCAHFEATSKNPIEFLQEVDSRCVVTELDWRYEFVRSDVQGVNTWVSSPIGQTALQMPSFLREQCRDSFSDAVYCTPTLIALPEKDSSHLTLCSLRTQDYRFGLGPILTIASSNSRWECQSKSLIVPDKDRRLSVEERACVPDQIGQLMNVYCRLPYVPVARHPLRVFIPQ